MPAERIEALKENYRPCDQDLAAIATASWNQNDIVALNRNQDFQLPAAFGSFELTESPSESRPAKQIYLAQNRTLLSERVYKQEVPPSADRELHSMFPELNSSHSRIAHAKDTIYDHLQEAHKHRITGSPINSLEFFRGKVNTNAPWDLKSFYKHPEKHSELSKYHFHAAAAPLWVQNYGNFNYGATAFALGLTEEQALIFAGAAQQGGTEKHPVKSPEGLLAGAKNTLKATVLPNHGDSDANDQHRIKQGYEWAQKHATELGLND
jgi:hypothetical protein